MNRAALVVITDGRSDYLERTWESFSRLCDYDFHTTILVDDSGSKRNNAAAAELVNPDHAVFHGRRMGGAASIRSAWHALREIDVEYVFHLEDDWTFLGSVPVGPMIDILDADDDLANVVLRRQPWGTEGPGGYIAANPAAFTAITVNGHDYMRHSLGFWLNPGVYRRAVTGHRWPANGHEHDFTARLTPLGYRFAVYGKPSDPPRCWHIGNERSASWTW